MQNLTSVSDLLERSVQLYPERIAVFDGYRSMRYEELANEVNLLASGLSQLGIVKGDRVIVCLPNWHELVIIYFALSKIGAILVPCDVKYRQQELEYIVNNSKPKAAFVVQDQEHLDIFLNRIHGHQIKHILTVRFKENGLTSFEELLELGKKRVAPNVNLDVKKDVFAILYTSGSTGKPKGAQLTHSNVVHVAISTAKHLNNTCQDVFLVPVPATHVFGLVPGTLTVISVGAKSVFMEKFKPNAALQLIEEEKVTVHLGVPTMFKLELDYLSRQKFDLSSLRTGILAGEQCRKELVRKIRTEMNCDIVISYGMTETSGGITFTSFEDNDYLRTETVGKPVDGAIIKAVDENGNEVRPGEVGELVCKGDGIMKGYYEMPSMTLEAFDNDGWFYTGDLGVINKQGYIRIVGRKKETINRGGYKIYPREIEEIFYEHPGVLEVAVFGMPDDILGEITCAVIKTKSKSWENEELMKDFLKNKVAKYKVPDKIHFINHFPLTESGKINKKELKKMILEMKTELN
ncbi:class I adenylate-forming enzyme family protein [Symbiobacterium thermophilum]|uniref:Long-chain acyl-CoA synthetase n=1 Tax=Symbiobacterium thermophilum TaxID=2734 RepID=A0A953ID21_SYMTR|nr:class I adenylate-forming enzyme family protein [Symbiobacterium thermophilum]MBY6276040.1 long-chain acyl-CoA synthetase [Symbiobacterium thermophilum]